MSLQFFVYEKLDIKNDKTVKIKSVKEKITSFEYTSQISDKMTSFRSGNFFSPETSKWIIENSNNIKLMNVFVMALTYEIFTDINQDFYSNEEASKETNIFNNLAIEKKFNDLKYKKYKIKLIGNLEEKEFNNKVSLLLKQIFVYSEVVKKIIFDLI